MSNAFWKSRIKWLMHISRLVSCRLSLTRPAALCLSRRDAWDVMLDSDGGFLQIPLYLITDQVWGRAGGEMMFDMRVCGSGFETI